MRDKINQEEFDKLCEAILLLKNTQECQQFLLDACTVAEIKAIAQRFKVANMLTKDLTYNDISKDTGASTATISRVNRALQYGSGGYTMLINRAAKTTND